MTEKALKTTMSPEELTKTEEEINVLQMYKNHCYLAIGKLIDQVILTDGWVSHGHGTAIEWIADPNGIHMKPRTARNYRTLWTLYYNILRNFGISEDEVLRINHQNLLTVARQIKKHHKDKEKVLELVHMAATLTCREIEHEHEESDYFVFDGRGRVCKWLNEKSGAVVHLSQVIGRIDASAQNWNEVFGQHAVEIKIRRKKDTENETK